METLARIQTAQRQHQKFMQTLENVQPFDILDKSSDHESEEESDTTPPVLTYRPHMPYAHLRAAMPHTRVAAPSSDASAAAAAATAAAPDAGATDSTDGMPPLETAQGVSMAEIAPVPTTTPPSPPLAPTECVLPMQAPILSPAIQRWIDEMRAYHASHAAPARAVRDIIDRLEEHATEQGGWGVDDMESQEDSSTAVAPAKAAPTNSTPTAVAANASLATPLNPPLARALLARHVILASSSFFARASQHAVSTLSEVLESKVAAFAARLRDQKPDTRKRKRRPLLPSTVDVEVIESRARESAHLESLRSRLDRWVQQLDAAREKRRRLAEEARLAAEAAAEAAALAKAQAEAAAAAAAEQARLEEEARVLARQQAEEQKQAEEARRQAEAQVAAEAAESERARITESHRVHDVPDLPPPDMPMSLPLQMPMGLGLDVDAQSHLDMLLGDDEFNSIGNMDFMGDMSLGGH